MTVPILAVTDEIDPRIHSASVCERMGHVRFVVSCGDLPTSYLEFIADALRKPVYFVHGNHVDRLGRGCRPGSEHHPPGGINLAGKVVRDAGTGLIMAGLPGSPRYSSDDGGQYDEWQIRLMIARMTPQLLWNKQRHGRALDLLVTHAPPLGVNDRCDPAHRGFEAIRDFVERFQPEYQLHGHIHLYDRTVPHVARLGQTEVVNVFPYRVLEVEAPVAVPSAAERGRLAVGEGTRRVAGHRG